MAIKDFAIGIALGLLIASIEFIYVFITNKNLSKTRIVAWTVGAVFFLNPLFWQIFSSDTTWFDKAKNGMSFGFRSGGEYCEIDTSAAASEDQQKFVEIEKQVKKFGDSCMTKVRAIGADVTQCEIKLEKYRAGLLRRVGVLSTDLATCQDKRMLQEPFLHFALRKARRYLEGTPAQGEAEGKPGYSPVEVLSLLGSDRGRNLLISATPPKVLHIYTDFPLIDQSRSLTDDLKSSNLNRPIEAIANTNELVQWQIAKFHSSSPMERVRNQMNHVHYNELDKAKTCDTETTEQDSSIMHELEEYVAQSEFDLKHALRHKKEGSEAAAQNSGLHEQIQTEVDQNVVLVCIRTKAEASNRYAIRRSPVTIGGKGYTITIRDVFLKNENAFTTADSFWSQYVALKKGILPSWGAFESTITSDRVKALYEELQSFDQLLSSLILTRWLRPWDENDPSKMEPELLELISRSDVHRNGG